MTESDGGSSRDLARRRVGLDRTASLVGRGLELAAALSKRARVQVVATGYSSFALFPNGTLMSWGLDECGQLGQGNLGFVRDSARREPG